jgi:hypothetical protein
MSLNPEYDGDITKAEGYYLAVARNPESGDFIGLYGLTKEGTFIRGAGNWITATGAVLNRLNGAQLVHMKDTFILRFDSLEKKGLPVTDEILAEKSTKGDPGSWDSQNK